MKYKKEKFEPYANDGMLQFVIKKYLYFGIGLGILVPSLMLLIAKFMIEEEAVIPFNQIVTAYVLGTLLFVFGQVVAGILDYKEFSKLYKADLEKEEELKTQNEGIFNDEE